MIFSSQTSRTTILWQCRVWKRWGFLLGYKRLQCRNITLKANILLDNSESDIMHKLVTLRIKWNLYNSKFSSSFTSLLNATSVQIYLSVLKNYSSRCGYIVCNYNISLYAFKLLLVYGCNRHFFRFFYLYTIVFYAFDNAFTPEQEPNFSSMKNPLNAFVFLKKAASVWFVSIERNIPICGICVNAWNDQDSEKKY